MASAGREQEETLSSVNLYTLFQWIAERAADRSFVFQTLAHHLSVELLRAAFLRTPKDKAPGVDGVTWRMYAEKLESNLEDLHRRLKERRYRAQPVRRVRVGKPEGGERLLGIPCLEDKIVQRAVLMLLNPIYEGEFYDFSYGFREGRGAKQALRALWRGLMRLGGGWLVDADIRGFFDHVDRAKLGEILGRRVNDGGILRLIGKWFHAGVLEQGQLSCPELGTPQGAVISPLLANVYLHTVLDEWYARQVLPRLRGRSFLIRFADDFVVVCELEEDARRVLEVLPKRLGRYGLSLHPEKTRLVRFRRPCGETRKGSGNGTFDMLGFTHYWGKSRKGDWVVKRKTAAKRLRRSLKAVTQWCRAHRHEPVAEQYKTLCKKLNGHYGYYGIRLNYRALKAVYEHTRQSWRKWLSRRSWRSAIKWDKFLLMERRYPLPRPRIVHADV